MLPERSPSQIAADNLQSEFGNSPGAIRSLDASSVQERFAKQG